MSDPELKREKRMHDTDRASYLYIPGSDWFKNRWTRLEEEKEEEDEQMRDKT